MVAHLVTVRSLPADLLVPAVEALKAREAKMSTAIGSGLALPHANVPSLSEFVMLFARAKEGMDCAALDGKPVNYFFMILVPPDQYATHLRNLSRISKFFSQQNIRDRLMEASSAEIIHEIFKDGFKGLE